MIPKCLNIASNQEYELEVANTGGIPTLELRLFCCVYGPKDFALRWFA